MVAHQYLIETMIGRLLDSLRWRRRGLLRRWLFRHLHDSVAMLDVVHEIVFARKRTIANVTDRMAGEIAIFVAQQDFQHNVIWVQFVFGRFSANVRSEAGF